MTDMTGHKRGGYRPGAGRKPTGRVYQKSFRLSAEAVEILNKQANQSEWVDSLIRNNQNP